jgi:hypothetical protein
LLDEVIAAATTAQRAEVIAAATSAQRAEGTVEDRLYGVPAVKVEFLVASVQPEFRAEMLVEAGAVAEDLVRFFEEGHLAIVEALLESAAG